LPFVGCCAATRLQPNSAALVGTHDLSLALELATSVKVVYEILSSILMTRSQLAMSAGTTTSGSSSSTTLAGAVSLASDSTVM
jgi:hypothetical protein